MYIAVMVPACSYVAIQPEKQMKRICESKKEHTPVKRIYNNLQQQQRSMTKCLGYWSKI